MVVAAAKLFIVYSLSSDDAHVAVCNVRDFVAETLESQGAKNHATFVQWVHESALGKPTDALPADRTDVHQGIIIGLTQAGFAHFCKVLTKGDEHAKKVANVVVNLLTSPVNGIPIVGAWAAQAINTGVAAGVDLLMPHRDYLPEVDRFGAQHFYLQAQSTGAAKASAQTRGEWIDAMMAFAKGL